MNNRIKQIATAVRNMFSRVTPPLVRVPGAAIVASQGFLRRNATRLIVDRKSVV